MEGEASYRYYRNLGDDVTIFDQSQTPKIPLPPEAPHVLGSDAFNQLEGFDLVLRTPPLAPKLIRTSGKIWSATREFFAQCPAPIIGVTGTKGKGTTSSFIASILVEAGKNVHVLGNIGKPALDALGAISPSDIVVYELSSFQLWDLEQSPQVAVVLMIEPDHLDVHTDFDEYVAAKSNIARHQLPDDVTIYHPTNAVSAQIAQATPGTAARYGVPDDGQAYVRDGIFYIGTTEVARTEDVKIPGEFNLQNACAAISAAWQFTQDAEAIARGLRNFTGLPHRLKHVASHDGVEYYDDSIATTPGSALAALGAFQQPKILILGGSDKGADYRELVERCRDTATFVVAIGQTGEQIHQLCQELGVASTRVTGEMDDVVRTAREHAAPGSVVILSPASASFDQYKSYDDRGDQFVAAVKGEHYDH